MTPGTMEQALQAPPETAVAAPPRNGKAGSATAEAAAPASATGVRAVKRLSSVDALRGLTILGMLLVNNIWLGPFAPKQLVHAGWGEGIHFADLVFPWFLLIVGLSIPLAAAAHKRRGLSDDVWYYKVFTRTFMLILLGCIVDSSVKGHLTFCLGVLQLIGLSYCVAALCAGLSQGARLGIAAGLLVVHYAVLRYFPVPTFGAGSFTETQNFVTWLNLTYLKAYHIDGLFSMVSTSGLCIIGTVMGDALRREEGISFREIFYLFATGLVLMGLGWLWSFQVPYSKPMWTSSYLLMSGGLGLVVLAFFRVTLDVTGSTWWAYPLMVLGANAITVYVVPIVVKTMVLQKLTTVDADGKTVTLLNAFYAWCCATGGDVVSGGWLYTGIYIAACWVILAVMYRFRIYLRV